MDRRRISFLAWAALQVLALSSCGLFGNTDGDAQSQRPPAPDGGVSSKELSEPSPLRPARPSGPTFLGVSDDELLTTLKEKRIVGARGTSGSSLSMYVNLEGSVDGAFKPKTLRGQRWSGEVAAYRIARLLGIHRVPPSTTHGFARGALERVLEDEPQVWEKTKNEAIVDRGDVIHGALTYWVPDIFPTEVDRLEKLPLWTSWLKQGGSIPAESLWLAEQLSEMIVFDYLTGNWDRWSGGNVLYGPQKKTLLIMDNNGAFNTRMSERIAAQHAAPLEQTERFSARLYRRLVGLSKADIVAELNEDPAGEKLLTPAQIDAVLTRRDEAVQRIEKLMAKHSRDAVLCFP